MRIITADERLQEQPGEKILIAGPPKTGKTSQLRTLDPATTLFLDLEAGDQAVRDFPVDTLRPQTWDDCRDLACAITGPNPAMPETACYSQAHYDAVRGNFADLQRYQNIFVDSLTAAARSCFRWCEQQPESLTDRGKKDVRGTYGLLAREMIGWLTHIQHARGRNVIFVCILEWVVDEYRRGSWQLQIEGQKTGRELGGIVDQVITMNFVDFGDGEPPVRAFVCTSPNPWNYPAGDRSGKLDMLEKPHLGELLAKLNAPIERRPFVYSTPKKAQKE
jgi:hypothetical protein